MFKLAFIINYIKTKIVKQVIKKVTINLKVLLNKQKVKIMPINLDKRLQKELDK